MIAPTVRIGGAVVRTVGDAGPYRGRTQCVCDCRGDLCVARGGVIQLPGHRWCRGGIGLRAIKDRPYGEDRRCSGKDRQGDAGPYRGRTQCVCDCRGDLCVARGGVIQLPGHRWCRGGIGFRATVRIGGAVVRTVRGTPVPTEEERSAFVIVGATCVSPVAEGEIRIDDR